MLNGKCTERVKRDNMFSHPYVLTEKIGRAEPSKNKKYTVSIINDHMLFCIFKHSEKNESQNFLQGVLHFRVNF